jgi:hypothetical protein
MPAYGMETSSFACQARVQNVITGELMLTDFGTQGLLLENYQERGSTVNRARYTEMLCDKLKPAV